jgi:hypothetical protein
MKRRNFIITASTVAIGVPAAYYIKKHYWKSSEAIFIPAVLSSFCDAKTLVEIGIEYRKRVAAENEQQKLKELILTDNTGKKLTTSDRSDIEAFINKKNQEEFSAYNTLIIKGWIISVTEARQCALFSLT